MSFARAKRFKDRESGVFGSPADYDISIRLGQKYDLGEDPKFQGTVSKDGSLSFSLAPRSNRSSRARLTCSTPKLRINKKRIKLRKKKNTGSSYNEGLVETGISSNQAGRKCQEDDETENDGNFFDAFENLPSTSGTVNRRKSNLPSTSSSVDRRESNLPSTSGSVDRRESNLPSTSGSVNIRDSNLTSASGSINRRDSIDDDSDNLTISEVMPTNRLRVLEIFNNESEINESSGRYLNFREMALEKIDKIEKNVEQLRKVMAYLNRKIQMGQMQKQHDRKNARRYPNSEDNSMLRQKYDEIVRIIINAIKKLNDEFVNERKESLKHIEKNIYQFMKEISIRNNEDIKHMKRTCETSLANLITETINILNTTDVGELEYESSKHESEHESSEHESSEQELSEHLSLMIRETEPRCDDVDGNADTYFNYENTCKILSDQLWNSKNELDVLEQEKLDISIKFSNIKRALKEQESIVDILQTEIDNLRLDVTKNV